MIHTTQEKKVVIQGLDGYIVAETNMAQSLFTP